MSLPHKNFPGLILKAKEEALPENLSPSAWASPLGFGRPEFESWLWRRGLDPRLLFVLGSVSQSLQSKLVCFAKCHVWAWADNRRTRRDASQREALAQELGYFSIYKVPTVGLQRNKIQRGALLPECLTSFSPFPPPTCPFLPWTISALSGLSLRQRDLPQVPISAPAAKARSARPCCRSLVLPDGSEGRESDSQLAQEGHRLTAGVSCRFPS